MVFAKKMLKCKIRIFTGKLSMLKKFFIQSKQYKINYISFYSIVCHTPEASLHFKLSFNKFFEL